MKSRLATVGKAALNTSVNGEAEQEVALSRLVATEKVTHPGPWCCRQKMSEGNGRARVCNAVGNGEQGHNRD